MFLDCGGRSLADTETPDYKFNETERFRIRQREEEDSWDDYEGVLGSDEGEKSSDEAPKKDQSPCPHQPHQPQSFDQKDK